MNMTTTETGDPAPIKAIPLRRPGRWVAAVVVVVLVGLFIYGSATNEQFGWATYRQYLFDARISKAAWVTIQLTILSMAAAIVLGIVLAVMRLSPNPVLKSAAWVYLWVFRGTPVYVQLVFWGLFPSIYKSIDLGVPFVHQFVHFDMQDLQAAFLFAVIGLALNEAAYMAEIVRAGIASVNEGQTEASVALGMTWGQTMRRTVLPQAMRVIIPPTGNELISLLKTTSLVTAVPLSTELYGRARDISGCKFRADPTLDGRGYVVPRNDQCSHGRPVLRRTPLFERVDEDAHHSPAPGTRRRTGQRNGSGDTPGYSRRRTQMTPMVKADRVCKNFGALEVLKGVSLEIDPGQVLCLVGPSGSGKSTFLRCINHLEQVNAGRLYVDGDLVGYSEKNGKLYELHPRAAAKQRRDIGMVFQHFNLFPHRTALENIIEAPTQVKRRQ